VGSYYLKAKPCAWRPCGQCRLCGAGHCRGEGLGSLLCQHSLAGVPAAGVSIMQFNLVVSTQHRRGPLLEAQMISHHRHPCLGFSHSNSVTWMPM